MSTTDKPTVFISYSHKDEVWKDRLVSQLGVLSEQGLLTFWDDCQIGVGEDWYKEIQDAMNAANVALLLISADSLTSKFILREEVKHLLQRRDEEGLIIFPIIVRSCPWQKVDWLSRMQVRPRDGKPLASYGGNRRDEALSNIATEVYERFTKASTFTPLQDAHPSVASRVNITRLPVTGPQLFGRDAQLRQLDEAWAGNETHIISLVAWGGVGKSALVNYWLARLARDDYRGAERVYAWSFYSQGTTDRAVSADQFIEAALTWFGDPDPNKGSPWDKGERLAQLVASKRTLLILDGLEPLQNPPGADEGKLKDQALQSLLRSLAAHNRGLCVISTRVAVADLAPFENTTAPRIDLDTLSPQAGAQVLTAQGVKGEQSELEKASEEFGGHSLALTLLGSYLADVYGGDITRRTEAADLESDVRHGGHAQRVMASYEKWFDEGAELSVLRILGLFNRPADRGSIDALRAAPAIPGLTDALQALGEPQWQQVLSKLRRAKLLAAPSANQPGTLDTHPLVREHFGHQLKRDNPDAWREGNNRLYEHLTRTAKEFPDTLEEMAPLYAAIAHGCEAGRHQETFYKVYIRRISRANEFFSTRRLGAFGADLAGLNAFFVFPWREFSGNLDEDSKAYILNAVGFRLHALGRLVEATEPIRLSLERRISQGLLSNASAVSSNLSQLYLIIGDLPKALDYAKQSLELIESDSSSFMRITRRVGLANTLHQLGHFSEAEALFRDAEKIQQEARADELCLYGLQGFQFCDLLLDGGRYDEVETRATISLTLALNLSLYAAPLDHLSLARAYLLRNQHENDDDFSQASAHLEQALEGLRQAGTQNFIPLGLKASAELYRAKGELHKAQSTLNVALDIANRSGMSLYEADCYLEYARLYLARGERERARGSWERARGMIERMGYHRRDRDVREIEEELKKASG